MKKWILSAVAVSISLLWVGVAAAEWGGGGSWEEEVVERTVELTSGGELSVESFNGGITIQVWDRSEVGITARKRARSRKGDSAALLRQIEIDIRQTPGRVEIETIVPRDKGWRHDASYGVEYELMVPRDISVEARSTNGGIEIDGVAGAVSLRTVNGGITAADIGGSLEASTTNGGIRARRIGGFVEASSINGNIDAEMLAHSLTENIELSTTNGSIELAVDAGLAASIEARTQNGSISGDLVERSSDPRRNKSARFDLNGGGPRITLDATNGRIRLDRI